MSYLKKELYELISNDNSIFDFIQESALDGLWYWDLEKPEEEWMNPKFWTTLGYNPEEMPHKSSAWQNIIFPEDLAIAANNITKHLEDPNHPYDQICRYKHKNGSTKWIRCTGKAIRDESGKPTRMLGAHIDITDLKYQEELLEKCNEAALIGYWEVDLIEQKLYWSRMTKIIHETPLDFQPVLETAINFFKVGENREEIIAKFTACAEYGKPYDVRLQIITAKNNLKWVRSIGQASFVNGKCAKVYGTFQDITTEKVAKLALIKEKEKLQTVLEGTKLGTWEWNISTERIKINSSWANMLGYTLDDLKPINIQTWTSLAHPDDIVIAEKKIEECFEKNLDSYDIECRMRHKNGEWIWLLSHGRIIKRTQKGDPLILFGTSINITKSKKVFESNKSFIEQTPTAIAMFDNQLNYIACSEKWLIEYGLEGQEIIGKSHYEIFPEINEDRKKTHQRCLQGSIEENEAEPFLRQDGTVQWLKWLVKPWYSDSQTIGGLIMFTEDITDRKKAEEAFRISEEAFRGNFENAAIGMALLNESGQWMKVNQSLCKIVGYTEQELMQITFQDITHPEDLDADLKLLNELIAGDINFYHIEKRYICKNGDIVHIILAASLVRDENQKPLYFISQIIDITSQKKAEEEIQSLLLVTKDQNERLKNFAHIVSHNLRSHSGNIAMMIDLLLYENKYLAENDIIQLLETASKNLKETIAHLNEVVLMNTTISDNLISINLKNSIASSIQNLQALINSAHVEIQNEIQDDVNIKGIPAYVESILLNFISNAIKYRSTIYPPTIKLYLLSEKNRAVLCIADNGIGIDLEKNGDKVFGMYKTFHSNEDARGIGLFITKNQIEALGGKVEIESELNKGTTFKIYFNYA
jgi:PAS domain S-box-containing protein